MTKQEEIKELQKKRRQELSPLAERTLKMLAEDIYAKSAHYIYELLQNADDAEATKVIFKLTDSALEIQHNGKKLFDKRDVESITYIDESTKKDEPNKIGKFGAGFKSVFNITDAPEIYSGGYHFKITNYVIPSWIDNPQSDAKKTLIRLPFKTQDNCSTISEQLENLDKECLLFLNHIKTIRWDEGDYSVKENHDKTISLTAKHQQTHYYKYLKFNNTITISKKQNISIAFLLNEDNQIIAIDNAKPFVFFPIEKEKIGLKFLVHAPYKTTPSRETINFEVEENQQISQTLAKLVADNLEQIKKQKLLTVDFLSLLPLDAENNNPLYQAIFEKVKESLTNKPLLPTDKKGWTSAKDALLARESKLTDLLNPKDCLQLFDKKHWLSTDITSDKKNDLYKYLTNKVGIEVISMEKFCEKIDKKFIREKSDNWLIKFYKNVQDNARLYQESNHGRLKGVLRERSIIRLSKNNQLVCPEDENGNIQVYLPTGRKPEFKTVKLNIAKNKQAKEFLQKLGLTEPDGVAEIKEFIAKKYNKEPEIDKQEYLDDFKNALTIYQKADTDDKTGIIDLLNDCYFIYCQNQQKQNSYQKPSKVYFVNDNTNMWFQGNTDKSIYFLAKAVQSISSSKDFLAKLGVNTNIRLFKDNGIVDIQRHAFYQRSVNDFNPEFDIHGLSFAIENITMERSQLLWKILLEKVNKLKGCLEEKTNQNIPYEKGKQQESEAGKLLIESKHHWLYDKKKTLCKKPLTDILLDDLHEDYDKEHDNIEKLTEVLGLKLDEVKAFEEKTGLCAMSKEEKEDYERLKTEEQKRKEKEQQTNHWQYEVEPQVADIKSEVYNPPPLIQKDLSGQTPTPVNAESTRQQNATDANLNEAYRAEIGDWGEKCAKQYLKNEHKYKEIVWLNENDNVGEGYDFVIREDGKDLFYYEVKSKIDETPKLFQITGPQWDWAKTLYARGDGDKYIILLVSNAGKNAIIKEIINPVKLWKEGKLDANPVNIKLR